MNQLISNVLVEGMTLSASGLSSIAFDATGGFQAQRQEVENLKGELAELSMEYEEAISEGDAARAAQLTNEMSKLKDEISDLEDPIHNLKEAFRSFFKDVVDGVRKMIIEWLVMKAITGIFGAATGAAAPALSGSVEGGMASFGITSLTGHAHGGILPNIKAFRAFSSGGVTSRPTLALLGDNRSGRELVIPTENIKSDEVSGYTRDSKQAVNIVNVVTEQDFHRIMASQAGKNIIVNTVGQDMQRRGTTFRSYNM
jgi:ATP-dependent Clp protease ATP-binding subunit ClpA